MAPSPSSPDPLVSLPYAAPLFPVAAVVRLQAIAVPPVVAAPGHRTPARAARPRRGLGEPSLKFVRKSHASALTEGAVDSDASSVDESPAGDGSMLKNLISQEDSGASSKASRSFSLLSPFRSKHKVIVL